MIRRPPQSTRTDTLCPYTPPFRSCPGLCRVFPGDLLEALRRVADGRGRAVAFDERRRAVRAAKLRRTLAPGNRGCRRAVHIGNDRAWPRSLQHRPAQRPSRADARCRSEEHTSELQSLMRISYAVFCLKKKKKHTQHIQSRMNSTTDS